MGRRSRQRRPERRRIPAPAADLAGEWKALTRGEAAFVAVVALGIVALAVATPGGVLNAVLSAAALGLFAGMLIALNRRRGAKRPG